MIDIPVIVTVWNRAKFLVGALESIKNQDFEGSTQVVMCDDGFSCMAVNDDNWADCIQELIDNKEKRQYIGKEAYKFAIEKFDINKNIQIRANAYEEILNS